MEQGIEIDLENLSPNSDSFDLLETFKEIRAEEERLLKIRTGILTKQDNLKNQLTEEIEQKKVTITNLTTEIQEIEKKNQRLMQVLGIDSYNGTKIQKITSPPLKDMELPQTCPDCVGLLKCGNPEKCSSYESCLKQYLDAEMRNDSLNL